MSTFNHFATIRKQLIWGNTYIKGEGKCLLFNNWIDRNIIYINNRLDEKEKYRKNIFYKRQNFMFYKTDY